jgi:hypothetical protein
LAGAAFGVLAAGLPNIGAEFTPHLGVVLERFSVLWPQRDEPEVLAAREDAYVRTVWIEDRDWLPDTMRQRWDGLVVSRSEVLEPARLPTLARRTGWRRLWLVTTNDNTAALRFYQRAGWELVAFHHNALAQSRVLKPSIPQMGLDSIPIRHELELELPLP